MKILPGIKIVDLSLYLEKEKILILSDLHLGYEEYLNEKGILVPRFQYKEIIERINKILKQVNPRIIILNGDLKHEFGSILRTEWKQILDLIDFLKDKEVIIIKGNHDPIIEPIANKKNVKVLKQYKTNTVSIVHGDFIPEKLKKTIVIGHEHPAISFKDRPDDRYKCFLLGKYKSHNLIVIPSFSSVQMGRNILKEEPISPFIKNINNFEAFIIEDKIYKFGKLKNIK